MCNGQSASLLGKVFSTDRAVYKLQYTDKLCLLSSRETKKKETSVRKLLLVFVIM